MERTIVTHRLRQLYSKPHAFHMLKISPVVDWALSECLAAIRSVRNFDAQQRTDKKGHKWA